MLFSSPTIFFYDFFPTILDTSESHHCRHHFSETCAQSLSSADKHLEETYRLSQDKRTALNVHYASIVMKSRETAMHCTEIIGGDVRDIYLLSPLGYKLIITTGSREGQVPISLKG